jgi:diguanylate cyclase (GGDEF)-like protein/PAS domain S-box-containing protein
VTARCGSTSWADPGSADLWRTSPILKSARVLVDATEVTAAPRPEDLLAAGATAPRAASLVDLVDHLADHIPEIVTVVDPSGVFLAVAGGSERLLGRPAADLVGVHASEVVHPDDLGVGMERFVTALASGRDNAEPLGYRLAHADGSWIPVELVASPVTLADGQRVVVVTGRRVSSVRARVDHAEELSRRTARVFENAAIGMAQLSLDGCFLRANLALGALLGTEPDALVGRAFGDFVHPEDRWALPVRTDSRPDGQRVRVVFGPDHAPEVRHVQLVATVVQDRDGADLYHVVQVVDVTEAVLAQEALAESEQRFRTILDLAEEGVVALDSSLVVTFVNRHLADMLACEPGDLVGRTAFELFPMVDMGSAGFDLDDEATWPEDGMARFEARVRAMDGTERWVMIAANAQALAHPERNGSVVAMITDITALKSAEAELRHRSSHDPLTGLANRSFLEDRRVDAERMGRDASGRAVIYVDLDGFKEINDTYGHQLGDRMLAAVAARLQTAVRGADVLVRLGGDEFLVWLETDDERAAVRLADRLLYNLVDPFVVDGHTLTVGASAGVAVGQPGDHLDDLMRRADRALYEAKHAGGRRFVVHGADTAGAIRSPARA